MPKTVDRKATPLNVTLYPIDRQRLAAIKREYKLPNNTAAIRRALEIAAASVAKGGA